MDEAEQVVQDDVPLQPSDSPAVRLDPPYVVAKEEVPRNIYVKTDVLNQIGYTPGSLGCRALQLGRTRVGHSDQCQQRAVETMEETALGRERLSAARKREDEYVARAVQQSDEFASKRIRIGDPIAVPVLLAQPGRGGNSVIVAAPLPDARRGCQPRRLRALILPMP